MKKFISLLLVFVLCFSITAQGLTPLRLPAAELMKDMQTTAAQYLNDLDKPNHLGWDVFALSVSGHSSDKLAGQYYQLVAATDNFSQLTPSEVANMILSLGAYGYDTTKIGAHNLQAILVEKLKAMDFASASYHTGYNTVSTVWSPFLALHFLNIQGFDKSVLGFQIAKHLSNESYYSYKDTYPSIETEAMLMVALAPFKGQSFTYRGETISVSAAVNTAAEYYKRIGYHTGGFIGPYGQSVEANSWIAHAFYACGIPYDKELLFSGINDFYDVPTGGFTGYGGVNEYSTQQALYNITGCLLAEQNQYVFDISKTHGTKVYTEGTADDTSPDHAILTNRRATISLAKSPIQGKSVQLYENETPLSLLTCLIGKENISIKNGYVEGIRLDGVWLKEFDKGPKSGWKFSLNNQYIPAGGNTVNLSNGDVINWYYSTGVENRDFPAAESFSSSTGTAFSQAMADIKQRLEGSALTEWDMLAKQLSGKALSDVQLQALQDAVAQKNGDFRKVTDTARYSILLGYSGQAQKELLYKIQNHPNMTMQGINGPIFALLALNAGGAAETKDTLWTREKLREYILSAQKTDGSFGLTKDSESNADLTAMAIYALSPYKAHYQAQLDKAVAYLAGVMNSDGSFTDKGIANIESTAQVIMALSSLGINPAADPRFEKQGKNPVDALLSYYTSDGLFLHNAGGKPDAIASEQASLALFSLNFLGQPVYLPKPHLYDDFGAVALWAQDSVTLCYQKGLMIGTGFSFEPTDSITLWQAKTVLNRIFGTLSPVGADTVTPITRGTLLELLNTQGCGDLLYGNGNGDLMLGDTVDRQTLATIAARIYQRTMN